MRFFSRLSADGHKFNTWLQQVCMYLWKIQYIHDTGNIVVNAKELFINL